MITVDATSGLHIELSTEDPNHKGFYVIEIALALDYNPDGYYLYDERDSYSFNLDVTVKRETTYTFCAEDDGGTGILSPSFDLCDIFYSVASADNLDCPPASGLEVCSTITKYQDTTVLDTLIRKIDSDGLVWKPRDSDYVCVQSSGDSEAEEVVIDCNWTLDQDYFDSVLSSAETQEYMGRVGFELVNEGVCSSSNAPSTTDIIYEVQEDCYSSTIEKSPYPNLSATTVDNSYEPFSLSLLQYSWDFEG